MMFTFPRVPLPTWTTHGELFTSDYAVQLPSLKRVRLATMMRGGETCAKITSHAPLYVAWTNAAHQRQFTRFQDVKRWRYPPSVDVVLDLSRRVVRRDAPLLIRSPPPRGTTRSPHQKTTIGYVSGDSERSCRQVYLRRRCRLSLFHHSRGYACSFNGRPGQTGQLHRRSLWITP